MTKKLLVAFAVLGLALASAKTYSLTLFQPSTLAGTELKAGEYKVELQNDKVVVRGAGKQVGEAPVKVETGNAKFSATTVRFSSDAGKYQIREIRLGGTNLKLVVTN